MSLQIPFYLKVFSTNFAFEVSAIAVDWQVTSQCAVGYKFSSTDRALDWLFDTVGLHVISQQRFFVFDQLATNVALERFFKWNAVSFQVLLKTLIGFK
jgi:hypothetical protein